MLVAHVKLFIPLSCSFKRIAFFPVVSLCWYSWVAKKQQKQHKYTMQLRIIQDFLGPFLCSPEALFALV